MKQFLIKGDINSKSIFLEEKAKNTAENAYYCIPILVKNNISEVTLITSDFHMPRSSYLFEAIFKDKSDGISINNKVSTKSDFSEDQTLI